MSDLASINAKVSWAYRQIPHLEAGIREFSATNPYRTWEEVDSGDFPQKRLMMELTDPIPDDISIQAGNILYQLRSSLDYLAVVLVERGGRTPDRRVSFPIRASEGEFLRACPAMLKGMAPADVEKIKYLQPYKGGPYLLYELHELNRVDKHTRLVAVGGFGRGALLGGYKDLRGIKFSGGGPIEQGSAEIVAVHPHDSYPEFTVAVDVAFQPISGGRPMAVVPTLRQLVRSVNSVITQFERG